MKYLTPPKNSLGTQLFLSSKYLISFGAVALLLTGCQTTPRNNLPTLSLAEADAARQQLISDYRRAKAQNPDKQQEIPYIQPVNKTEACLIPRSPVFLALPGFKEFWDGDCKNGRAYGLGRSIVIADDGFHHEEVCTHSDDGSHYGPVVFFDFQGKRIGKGIVRKHNAQELPDEESAIVGKLKGVFKGKSSEAKSSENYDSESYFTEYDFVPWPGHDGYTAVDITMRYDAETQAMYVQNTVTIPKYLVRAKEGVVYRMTDMSAKPQSDINPVQYGFDVLSPSGQLVGVSVGKFKDGRFIPFKVGGTQMQPVNVPPAYFDSISKAMQEADQLVKQVREAEYPAQQMLDQYLAGVCNNPKVSVPKGLTKAKYLEICTFEKNLVAQANKSIAVVNKEFEKAKEKAAIELAENERKYREEQEHQARMNVYRAQADSARRQAEAAEAQANAAQWANMNASIANMSRSTNAMLQNTMRSTPQVYTPSIGSSTSIYYVNPVTPNVTTVKKLR